MSEASTSKVVEEDLISVIIPVFNAERYLNRCLQSVVGQRYRNLEIILVNDASIDGSLELCRKWEEADRRIKVYNQTINMGQGQARDNGVRKSSGKYIMFIDADDTVELDFVKLMHCAISSEKAEMGICDFGFVWEGEMGERQKIRRESVVLKKFYCKKETDMSDWKEMSFSLCNRIYERYFWDKCKIRQLGKGFAEDVVALITLTYYAKKIVQVRSVLYNYYQNDNSTVHSKGYSEILKNTLGVLSQMYDSYKLSTYNKYIMKYLAARLIGVNELSDGREKEGKEKELVEYFEQIFSPQQDMAFKECVVFGSYSLRTIVRSYRYFMPEAYGFSSLISLMSHTIDYSNVTHSKRFRQLALEGELKKSIINRLVNKKTQFLFMDFLEERYGVLELENGGFLTNSEALKEAELSYSHYPVKEVKACTEAYFSLWEKACVRFISLLKSLDVKVVIIQNRLTNEYGNLDTGRNMFANQDWIASVNSQCKRMEEFFISNFQEVMYIKAEKNLFYSDESFPYGCAPWHMNCYWYYQMGLHLYHKLETSD